MKSLFLFSFALFVSTIYSQSRFDNVVIKEHKITDQIYMLEGSGGNIGLYIGDGEAFMIDDQFAPLSEKIMNKISELTDHKVQVLVNTHWHGDHTGGNENFGKEGAIIIAHDNVYERMSKDQERNGRVTPAAPEVARPVITFSDDMTLRYLEEPILLTHVHNAHTDGDAFVYFTESNVLHMGDCFFNQRFPYIDISSGGSFSGLIAAVETAAMIVDDETTIIPGHGPIGSKLDLLNYHKFLIDLRSKMESEIASGKTADDMDPAAMTKGYESWSTSFMNAKRLIGIVYASMTEE